MWCIEESSRTAFRIFGTYQTSVTVLVKPNRAVPTLRFLLAKNCSGILLLFFFAVPTYVNFFFLEAFPPSPLTKTSDRLLYIYLYVKVAKLIVVLLVWVSVISFRFLQDQFHRNFYRSKHNHYRNTAFEHPSCT